MPRIMPDTCMWIHHYDRKNPVLKTYLLRGDDIVTHDMIKGELVMGTLKDRQRVITEVNELECIDTLDAGIVRAMVEKHQLYGLGLQWVDVNLLCSAIANNCAIVTTDRRLERVSQHFAAVGP